MRNETEKRGDRRVLISEQVTYEKPFARLLRFDADFGNDKPPMLIAAPLSGLRTALLYDMVAALTADHEVRVLAWRDAADVPMIEGAFGIDNNIEYLIDAIRHLHRRVHLVGLCQSALPALAATALLVPINASLCPLTLTLIGGKLDTRISPTRLDRLTRSQPVRWFEQNVITAVTSSHPGEGRLVYSTCSQAASIFMYLARHFGTGGELSRKAFFDDGSDPVSHPFLPLFMQVMNVPAELFIDMVSLVFHESALPRGLLRWRGASVDPSAIRRTALFTVEGAEDDISGPGQTRVAHELCDNIPSDRRTHYEQPGVGHFGLFHGRAWREEIMPRIRAFVRAAECLHTRDRVQVGGSARIGWIRRS